MEIEGKLIVLCGIDGSGKTTQSEILCDRLRRRGLSVQYLEFPRYGESFFGDLIARYLRGEFARDAGEVSPYLASLPFACDRWEARPLLRKWLKDGRVVVCNRYVSANLAHQGTKIESAGERRSFRRWVAKMEYEVFSLPRPDLHVWLDVPPGTAVRLISGKGERAYLEGEQDIHEGDLRHLRGAREMYESLAAEGTGWRRIRCVREGEMLGEDQVARLVWQGVSEVLGSVPGAE